MYKRKNFIIFWIAGLVFILSLIDNLYLVKITPSVYSLRKVRNIKSLSEKKIQKIKGRLKKALAELLVVPTCLTKELLPMIEKLEKKEDMPNFRINDKLKGKVILPEVLERYILYENVKYHFASLLWEYREEKGYTRQELVKELPYKGTPRIYRYENGTELPPTIVLLKIIKFLNIDKEETLRLLRSYYGAKLQNRLNDLEPVEIADGLYGAVTNENAISEFSNYFKKLRKDRNLSIKELAQKSGLDIYKISRYENGKRVIDKEGYQSIVEAFKLNQDSIVASRAYVKWLDAYVRYKIIELPSRRLRKYSNILLKHAPAEFKKLLLQDELLKEYIGSLYIWKE